MICFIHGAYITSHYLSLYIVNGRMGADLGVGGYTRVDTTGKSLVDYLLATPATFTMITDLRIHPKTPESDHLPISFNISYKQTLGRNFGTQDRSTWQLHQRYSWDKDNLENLVPTLTDDTSNIYYQHYKRSVSNLENTNVVASNFSVYFNQACERTFDLKSMKKSGQHNTRPRWYDVECRMKRAEAIKAGERVTTMEEETILHQSCREYRALKQKKQRIYEKRCAQNIEEIFMNDRSNLWKALNKLSPYGNDTNMPSRDEFYSHFKGIAGENHDLNFDYRYEIKAIQYLQNEKSSIPPAICPVEYEILNSNFTVDEIKASINTLHNNKSPGIDCIPSEFLKHCRDIISEDITELFNYIIETREFPETWTEGLRSPIFKSGVKMETCNYRGITVLPIFEKIFEITVQKRLEFVNEAFRKTDRYNGGFLKGSRTTDNLFILNGLIERQLHMGQSLIVCHVDFTQAFDRVNRNILFYKIKKFGCTGRVIDTLQNLYSKTRYRVKCNGGISDIIWENVGVNQGGNASPILFRSYLSDIKDYLDEYTGICISNEIILHMLWADDLYMVSCNTDHAQRQLNGLSKFCAPNQMVTNEIKTKYMAFGKIKDVKLKLNGKLLEQVQSYKCLGNIISSTKTVTGDIFGENYEYLCEKARKSTFAMLNKTKSLHIPPQCTSYMYQSLIQPILLYGSDIWGMNTAAQRSLDKVFYWFLKILLNVKRNTSNVMLVGEVGMFPQAVSVIETPYCTSYVWITFHRTQ